MNKEKKKTVVMLLGILTLIVMTIGVTYAAFTFTGVGSNANKVTTGTITMVYTEGTNKISIENAMPMSDEEGKKLSGQDEVFDFTVEINITGDMAIAYEVTAEKVTSGDKQSTLGDTDVKLYLEKSTDNENFKQVMAPSNYSGLTTADDFGAKVGEMVLENGITSSTAKFYYKLRMWVDEDYEVTNAVKTYTVKINVYGKDGKNKTYANGTAVYFNPETNTKCSESEATDNYTTNGVLGTKTGCMKWYTFNDEESSDTVNMILDHNTSTSSAYNINDLTNNITTWIEDAKTTARLITVPELAEITGNDYLPKDGIRIINVLPTSLLYP